MLNEKGYIMNNPILKSSLFWTPDSEQELCEYIDQLSGPEKALAYKMTMFAFNLAHKMVNDANQTEEAVQ
jgi:hypothetical protein